MALGVANSFLLREREGSCRWLMRRFSGRFGLLMAKSAVIRSSFDATFLLRLRHDCLSLMTEETLCGERNSRRATSLGLLALVYEWRRFSDWAFDVVNTSDAFFEFELSERWLFVSLSVTFLMGVRMLLAQL